MRFSPLLATALLLSLTGIGCDDGVGNCDAGIELCDVQDEACQAQIFAATACQRRQKAGKFPSIRSITSEQFADELRSEGGPPGPVNAWDVALGMLGLLNPGAGTGQSTSDALVDGVLGFYDPATQQVTLLSDASGLSREEQVMVLSHEFVHVLQDRKQGLRRFDQAVSTDGSVSNDCTTEGEAVFHSNAALRLGEGLVPEELNWDTFFDDMRAGALRATDASSSPLVQAAINLPYSVGGRFVTDAWLDAGQGAINRLYKGDRLFAVADWQQGYARGIESPRPSLDCDPPDGPDGYPLYGNDVFGLPGIAAIWAARGPGAERGWAQGRGWRGGRTLVYAKGGDEKKPPEGTVVVWQTRWADRAQAVAFADLVEEVAEDESEHAFSATEGRAALIALTDDPATLAWVERSASDFLNCEQQAPKALRKAKDNGYTPQGRPWSPPQRRHWFTRDMLGRAGR